MPVTSQLGWRTEFPWSRYLSWAKGLPAVQLVERSPIPPLGHFSLIRFAKSKDQQASRETASVATVRAIAEGALA